MQSVAVTLSAAVVQRRTVLNKRVVVAGMAQTELCLPLELQVCVLQR